MTPLSPKARFLMDKNTAEAHAKAVSTRLFEMATDAAMLQTQLNLPATYATEPHSAAANHHRMEGAMLFLNVLMTIGDPIPERPAPPDKGLNFDATKVK